jgi:hypothetical protein
MKKFLNEGNQIHNFISSFGSGTVINYCSGSDFFTSYGSGSTSQKVRVPVPQRCRTYLSPFVDSILERGTGTMPREIFQCPNVKSLSLKNNFLEWLHPEVGKALKGDVYQKISYLLFPVSHNAQVTLLVGIYRESGALFPFFSHRS